MHEELHEHELPVMRRTLIALFLTPAAGPRPVLPYCPCGERLPYRRKDPASPYCGGRCARRYLLHVARRRGSVRA